MRETSTKRVPKSAEVSVLVGQDEVIARVCCFFDTVFFLEPGVELGTLHLPGSQCAAELYPRQTFQYFLCVYARCFFEETIESLAAL